MSSMPYIEIIMVNYNGEDLLREYLPSIMSLDYPNFGVTVVDNNSTDGSISFLRSKYPQINIIENDENKGFSLGNNIGAESSSNVDYFCFLNTDVEVTPNFLSDLVEFLENRKDVGIVCPLIYNMNPKSQIQSFGFDYNRFGMVSARYSGKQKKPKTPEEVSYPSGAAFLIDADLWKKIGGFDEENVMYGDDTYIGLYTWLLGYKVMAVPSSVVYHEGGGSQDNRMSPFIAFHVARSRTRVYFSILNKSTIAFGFIIFLMHSSYQVLNDLFRARSFSTAKSRFQGYLRAFREFRSILDKRNQVENDRQHPIRFS